MRAAILRYKIYKDRFYLSISASIILHIICIYLYFLIPVSHREPKLRPISLGMIKPQAIMEQGQSVSQQSSESKQENKPIATTATTQSKVVKRKSTPTNVIQKPISDNSNKTTTATQAPPSADIDLQSLTTIPSSSDTFNPMATSKPSLSENLRRYDDNVKFDNLPSSIKDRLYQLYGSELDNMSKEDKDYLADSYFINAEVFQQTADRLGYPALARQLKQQGRGTIEFILNPDGSATDIRIVSSTGYDSLDDSMRRVIEQSAKNLKRPPKPIKIILDGDYRIQERYMP